MRHGCSCCSAGVASAREEMITVSAVQFRIGLSEGRHGLPARPQAHWLPEQRADYYRGRVQGVIERGFAATCATRQSPRPGRREDERPGGRRSAG